MVCCEFYGGVLGNVAAVHSLDQRVVHGDHSQLAAGLDGAGDLECLVVADHGPDGRGAVHHFKAGHPAGAAGPGNESLGDHALHDLGKLVIADVLRHNGFEVTDLGADAAPDTVVQAIRSHKPHILILSGTIQASALSIRGTIRTVEASGLRKTVRILVGGQAVKDRSPRLLGADARSDSVLDCLRICHEFMAQAAGDRI